MDPLFEFKDLFVVCYSLFGSTEFRSKCDVALPWPFLFHFCI